MVHYSAEAGLQRVLVEEDLTMLELRFIVGIDPKTGAQACHTFTKDFNSPARSWLIPGANLALDTKIILEVEDPLKRDEVEAYFPID